MNKFASWYVLVFVLLVSVCVSQAASNDKQSANQSELVQIAPVPVQTQKWIRAISNDDIAALKLMVKQYDTSELITHVADNGKSALMVASKKGDLPLIRLLIDAGARIDDATQTNGTAFMFAVLGKQKPVVEWLHAKGADINVVGSNGWTATTIAAAKGYDQLLIWLIERGANAQVRDVYRFTPFMRAVENNHETSARFLLSLPGTNINAQDEYDNSSLHHAVSADNKTMVELLLANGADTSLVNRDGLTAGSLHRVSAEIRDLLVQH